MEEELPIKEVISIGSTNGSITIFDVASSKVSSQLINGHTASISAIAWDASTGLFTAGEDHQIIHWNMQENGIRCKWKSGKGIVTAIAILPEGNSILTGERIITWWDLSSKSVIGTFTGHVNQVNSLNIVRIDNDTSYLISSATGDSKLSVWSLNEVRLCLNFIKLILENFRSHSSPYSYKRSAKINTNEINCFRLRRIRLSSQHSRWKMKRCLFLYD